MTGLAPTAAEAAACLAPDGRLRVAINLGNSVLAQRDPLTGELGGVSVFLAKALGESLGLALEMAPYTAAVAVFEALDQRAWDLAFLAHEPERAAKIAFSSPYVFIDGTYLVHRASTFLRVDDLDRDGVRIAVGRGAAYDLYLSRALRHAGIVRAETSPGAIDLFLAGEEDLDAAAGIRQALLNAARGRSDLRVLDDSFTRIEQCVAVPKARAGAQSYIRAFLKEMTVSGRIRAALDASGQDGAVVAPTVED